MGPGMDSSHQTLLEDCSDTLGPAALVAAVTPRGFRGALGGYGNLQRIATTFSSGSNGHSGYLADRSASLSLTPSSPLLGLPANGLHDDENHQLVAADNYSEGTVERGTTDGGVNHQGKSSLIIATHSAFDCSSRRRCTRLVRRTKWPPC
jgi:hypothetical protein